MERADGNHDVRSKKDCWNICSTGVTDPTPKRMVNLLPAFRAVNQPARVGRMDRVFDTIMQRHLILFGAVMVWLLFVASFLMPVTTGITMPGFAVFWHYVTEIWDLPEYWRQIQREPSAILISTFPFTNVAVFIAPVVLFRWPRWSGWLGGFLMAGGLVPLFIFFQEVIENQLRVGFYCWVTSIFLMALLCLLDWTRQRRIRDSAPCR